MSLKNPARRSCLWCSSSSRWVSITFSKRFWSSRQGEIQDLQQAHLRQKLVLAQELAHLGVDLPGSGAVFALIPAALEGWPVTLLR